MTANPFDSGTYFIVDYPHGDTPKEQITPIRGDTWRCFNDTARGVESRQWIEEHLRELIHRDNPYTSYDRVSNFLEKPVYALAQEPRILYLPTHRLEALESLIEKDPKVFQVLGETLFAQIWKGHYTRSFSHTIHTHDEEGFASLSDIRLKLSHAYEAMTKNGPVFEEKGVHYLPVEDQKLAKQLFVGALRADDLKTIIELVDGPTAQATTAHIIKDRFFKLADQYDGIDYTSLCMAETVTYYPSKKVYTEFSQEHARFVGTVGDMIKAGHVAWPEPKKSKLSSVFTDIACLFSARKREKVLEQKQFDGKVQSLRQNTFL